MDRFLTTFALKKDLEMLNLEKWNMDNFPKYAKFIIRNVETHKVTGYGCQLGDDIFISKVSEEDGVRGTFENHSERTFLKFYGPDSQKYGNEFAIFEPEKPLYEQFKVDIGIGKIEGKSITVLLSTMNEFLQLYTKMFGLFSTLNVPDEQVKVEMKGLLQTTSQMHMFELEDFVEVQSLSGNCFTIKRPKSGPDSIHKVFLGKETLLVAPCPASFYVKFSWR